MALDRKTKSKIRKAGRFGTLNGYPEGEWLEAIMHAVAITKAKPLHMSGARRLMDVTTTDKSYDSDQTQLSIRCMLRNVEESRVRQLTRAFAWNVVSHWRYCGPELGERRRDKVVFRCVDIWNLFERLATIDGVYKPDLFRSFITRNVVQVGDGYAATHPGVGGRVCYVRHPSAAPIHGVVKAVSETRESTGKPVSVELFCPSIPASITVTDVHRANIEQALTAAEWAQGEKPPSTDVLSELFRFTEEDS